MTTDECDEAISCLEEQLAVRLAGEQLRLMVLTRQQAKAVLTLLRRKARPRMPPGGRSTTGRPRNRALPKKTRGIRCSTTSGRLESSALRSSTVSSVA